MTHFGLAWQIWELICQGDSRIDPEDLIRILEKSGYECPDDLKD